MTSGESSRNWMIFDLTQVMKVLGHLYGVQLYRPRSRDMSGLNNRGIPNYVDVSNGRLSLFLVDTFYLSSTSIMFLHMPNLK